MTQGSNGLSKGVMALYTSASVPGTTLVASSTEVMHSIEAITPERTLSPVGTRGATPERQTDNREQSCLDLLDQAIDDEVINSYEQSPATQFAGELARRVQVAL
jgi:hypothetical protein